MITRRALLITASVIAGALLTGQQAQAKPRKRQQHYGHGYTGGY